MTRAVVISLACGLAGDAHAELLSPLSPDIFPTEGKRTSASATRAEGTKQMRGNEKSAGELRRPPCRVTGERFVPAATQPHKEAMELASERP